MAGGDAGLRDAATNDAVVLDAELPDAEPTDAEPTDAGPAVCGDGVRDPGEACDGAELGGATCTSVPGAYTGGTLACNGLCGYDTTGCILPSCGDGVVDTLEQCDDGNGSNDDACLNNCVAASCGDVYVWVGTEDCDDGNALDSDGCLNDCTAATCGDGVVWVGQENCDDNNGNNGDGCSAACAVEDYFACDGQPSVCSCVVYVNHVSTASNPGGASWADAYPSFAAGIGHAGSLAASAGSYCDVWAAGGTYATSSAYTLPTRVVVYGGFASGETAVYQRNLSAQATILDGLNSADSVIGGSDISEAGLDGVTVSHGSGSGFGGGVWLRGQNLILANCVFESNYAGDDGGGVYITTNSTVTISRCIFRNNTANHNGGGLAVRMGAQVVVADSLFDSNAANGVGGAGWVESSGATSSMSVTNCTIVSNSGNNGAGAIRNDGATLTVVGSILWNNGASEIVGNGGTTTVTYSNVQGGYAGAGNANSNPVFVNASQDNYALGASSPCIDSADGNLASGWDLLGNPRVDAPPANTGIGVPTYVDRGAYEYQP